MLFREEVDRLLAGIVNVKLRAIFSTIYATGARLGEVQRLQVSDIDRRPDVKPLPSWRIRRGACQFGERTSPSRMLRARAVSPR